MRMMMQVTPDQELFNAATRDGTVGQKMGRILEEQKPESVYFAEINGRRTAIIVVDIEASSQIPSFAEPWFLTFNARVRFHPVMNMEDLGKGGLEELGKKWG
jgi:hypothetical protein